MGKAVKYLWFLVLFLASANSNLALARTAYLDRCSGEELPYNNARKACKSGDYQSQFVVTCNKNGKEKDRRLCNSDGEKKGIYVNNCGGDAVSFSSLKKACDDDSNAGKLLVKCKKGREKKRKLCESSTPDDSIITHAEDSSFGQAALAVRVRFPDLQAARQSNNPKFIGSHTKAFGLTNAELGGFGISMVAHNGNKPIVGYDKILHATGELDEPNLLFFEKSSDKKIIGMGYSFEFDSEQPPQLDIDGFNHEFLIHEAGYHPLRTGGFDCAENSNLKKSSWDAGIRVDPEGLNNITRDDLKRKIGKVKHGRIWTLHVWFDPSSGLPAIAETDPWHRYGDNNRAVSSCAFYYQSHDH